MNYYTSGVPLPKQPGRGAEDRPAGTASAAPSSPTEGLEREDERSHSSSTGGSGGFPRGHGETAGVDSNGPPPAQHFDASKGWITHDAAACRGRGGGGDDEDQIDDSGGSHIMQSVAIASRLQMAQEEVERLRLLLRAERDARKEEVAELTWRQQQRVLLDNNTRQSSSAGGGGGLPVAGVAEALAADTRGGGYGSGGSQVRRQTQSSESTHPRVVAKLSDRSDQ
eukprot:GHVU01031029.1.p1 GENE.GHVU01031029.1~~GHVU01031029.1.p1  ORF type:complete len:225 (+),score=41.76 GHVU01031029.1:198-872(+)